MTEKIEYLELTDTELYEKFLENDKEAFNHIIKRYRKPLIAFLMTYVRNIEVAEDLAQDSFLYMIINKNLISITNFITKRIRYKYFITNTININHNTITIYISNFSIKITIHIYPPFFIVLNFFRKVYAVKKFKREK